MKRLPALSAVAGLALLAGPTDLRGCTEDCVDHESGAWCWSRPSGPLGACNVQIENGVSRCNFTMCDDPGGPWHESGSRSAFEQQLCTMGYSQFCPAE